MHFFKYLILPVLIVPFVFMVSGIKKQGSYFFGKSRNNYSANVTLKRAELVQPKISAAQGHKIAKANGCFSCHSINGTKKAGPTWKNLYGRKTQLKNGKTIVADSSYIHQSIVDPTAKVVKGFQPVMPSFSYLKKAQIESIIVYIKSISKKSKSSSGSKK